MGTRVARAGSWLAAQVGDQLLMMSPEHEDYIGLNELGARIWELAETPIGLDDLVAAIVAEYEATPDQVRTDVEKFLDEMVRYGAMALEAV